MRDPIAKLPDGIKFEPLPHPPTQPPELCPSCGGVLVPRSCKLLCPTPGCGYYAGCSDVA